MKNVDLETDYGRRLFAKIFAGVYVGLERFELHEQEEILDLIREVANPDTTLPFKEGKEKYENDVCKLADILL